MKFSLLSRIQIQPLIRNGRAIGAGPGVDVSDGARVCDPQHFGKGAGESASKGFRGGDPLRVADPRSETVSPIRRPARFGIWIQVLALLITASSASAAIRDGGIDPANLGKGEWIYSIMDCTNHLGGHANSVTNENSLMLFYKNQGVRYVMVKTGTGDTLYNGCYGFPQLTANFVNVAHANGIWVFGYNRSYATNTAGEVAIADYVFNVGADGFVWDAEIEWESSIPGVGGNGPALAWAQCSQVRSNWPNKFLAHAPFPIIYLHSSFPYKEFGFWCDAVMPQIYHFSSAGIKGSPSAAINWSDVNWKTWQSTLAATPGGISNGVVVNWTNAIKPIVPVQDVYGTTLASNLPCNSPASATYPDEDVLEFIDYCAADPNAQTVGGYQGVNFWRADLHGPGQWTNIQRGTSGSFPGVVNNIVLDDNRATFVGGWTPVRVFAATTTTPTYYGATGSDTNCFGTNYFSKAQGGGSGYAEFRPTISVAGDYDVYEWHPYVTNASSGTPFAITHALGTTTVLANQQINSGNWSLLGRFTFAAGTGGFIRVLDNFSDAGNLALADGLKLVFARTNSPTAPAISVQPANAVVTVGQNATFSVLATGASPLAYQWRFNDVDIANATDSSYTRNNVQTNDAGNYSVFITNALGQITSSNALLTVNFNVDIFLDNTNAEVAYVGTWTLGSSAAGRYLADYRYATAAAGGTATATYRPTIGVSGYYNVFIQYPQGSNRTTNAPWLISYQGGSTNVSVNQQVNGGGWLLLAAARPFAAGTTSYVQVSNNAGPAGSVVMADGVRLTYVGPLNVAPNITTQPQTQTVKLGSNMTLNVVATGVPAPAYQWRFNGTNLANATAMTFVRTNAQFADAGDYSVQVANVAGSVTSSNATLTVLPLAPLGFQSITASPDGRMTLVITGEPGYAYAVDRTTNFSTWQPITNLVNATGTSAITDHSASNAAAGFYRARQ